MKYSFPRAAQPVLRVLRRDVPRPVDLPELDFNAGGTQGPVLRWDGGKCPMGLHPEATSPEPDWSGDFEPCPDQATIEAFYKRWDSFTDPLAAVEAVWPRRKRR